MRKKHLITGLISMTSGNPVKALFSLIACVLATTSVAHDDAAFHSLMKSLAAVEDSRVAYSEVKTLSILQDTVRQTGVLSYVAPDTVIRQVLEPENETYTIRENTLVTERAGKLERTDLAAVPLLAAFVESFRGTLSGNAESLQEYYLVEFFQDDSAWRMQLQPRSRSLARFVEVIIFTGQGTQIDRIVIREANGDQSDMLLTPLLPVSVLNEQEKPGEEY